MPRSHRYGDYALLRPGPAHRRPWLRTSQLNIVGWSALLGTCAAAGGGVGVLLARVLGLTGWSGLVLAPVSVGAVVLADRRRWAGMEARFGWGGYLRAHGIDRPDRW